MSKYDRLRGAIGIACKAELLSMKKVYRSIQPWGPLIPPVDDAPYLETLDRKGRVVLA